MFSRAKEDELVNETQEKNTFLELWAWPLRYRCGRGLCPPVWASCRKGLFIWRRTSFVKNWAGGAIVTGRMQAEVTWVVAKQQLAGV